MNTYDKIETVMKAAGYPLAPHEFELVKMDENVGGRTYIGCSESALGRRLREMARDGKVSRKTREGKSFKEFALIKKDA